MRFVVLLFGLLGVALTASLGAGFLLWYIALEDFLKENQTIADEITAKVMAIRGGAGTVKPPANDAEDDSEE